MNSIDIKNKTFSCVRKGFDTKEVEAFLSEIADNQTKMEEEKTELLNKLEYLANKVEGYQNEKNSIQEVLIVSQNIAENIVKEAKNKASDILLEAETSAKATNDETEQNVQKTLQQSKKIAQEMLFKAKNEAEKITNEYKTAIVSEEEKLLLLKQEVRKFKSDVIKGYQQHIALLSQIESGLEPDDSQQEPKDEIIAEDKSEVEEQPTQPTPTQPNLVESKYI